MGGATITQLNEAVGAEITGVDPDQLVNDESTLAEISAALDTYGVLVFPGLNLQPEQQVAFCARLGTVDTSGPNHIDGVEGVYKLARPANPDADFILGTFNWHWDGCRLPNNQPIENAILLTVRQTGNDQDGTEFASAYHGYTLLTDAEKERFSKYNVLHSLATVEAMSAMKAELSSAQYQGDGREAPLVWEHRSGRRSLVLGITAQRIIGMDLAEGKRILDELLERTTAPEHVYRHTWTTGDTVIWNNRGVLHRALPYEKGSARTMYRTTLLGDEPFAAVA